MQVLRQHLTIKQRGILETMNGAIPEPFIRTAEALLALLGQHDTEPAWRRPLLNSARAAHAWKWLRRMLFGNYSQFTLLLNELDPDEMPSTCTRIARARTALNCASFTSKGWLALNQADGCVLIELFRRWALSVVRYSEAQGIGDDLDVRDQYYKEMKGKVETGIARGIGQGLWWDRE